MSRPKLLLADDSVTIRKVVELTFADEGIDVTAVGDAESAMQKFVENHPDIVLVDVGLDGTSGYQICEMIKADEATSEIPVLLLVGSFEPFDQDEAERVGADGFLTKPFHSIRDLVARVNDLLAQRSTAAVVSETAVEGDGNEKIEPDAFVDKIDVGTDGSDVKEDDDIENLYRSSFAETVEIDEYDTVDDLLGDTALDDEMIEASFPTEAYTNNVGSMSGSAASLETVEMSKEFDWSPDSKVTEAVPVASDEKPFEPKFALEEDSADEIGEPSITFPPFERVIDNLEETGQATEAVMENEAESVEETPAADDGVGTDEDAVDKNLQRSEVSDIAEPEREEVTEPIEEVHSSGEFGPAAIEEPQDAFEAPAEPEVWPDVEAEVPHAESPVSDALQVHAEMIDLIVEKVVERLSDRVIREVALEAVPRVAEKLIREALETSGRKD